MYNALIKRISSREYIPSITDDKLFRFPVAFIEFFFIQTYPLVGIFVQLFGILTNSLVIYYI